MSIWLPDVPWYRFRPVATLATALIVAYRIPETLNWSSEGAFNRQSGNIFVESDNTAESLWFLPRVIASIALTEVLFSGAIFMGALNKATYQTTERSIRKLIKAFTQTAIMTTFACLFLPSAVSFILGPTTLEISIYCAITAAWQLIKTFQDGRLDYQPLSPKRIARNLFTGTISALTLLWLTQPSESFMQGAREMWTVPANATAGTQNHVLLQNSDFLANYLSKLNHYLIGITSAMIVYAAPRIKIRKLLEQYLFRLPLLLSVFTTLVSIAYLKVSESQKMHPMDKFNLSAGPTLIGTKYEVEFEGMPSPIYHELAYNLLFQGLFLINYYALAMNRLLNKIITQSALTNACRNTPIEYPRAYTRLFDFMSWPSLFAAWSLVFRAKLPQVLASAAAGLFFGLLFELRHLTNLWRPYTVMAFTGPGRTWTIPPRFAFQLSAIAAMITSTASLPVFVTATAATFVLATALMHFLEANGNAKFWQMLHLSEMIAPSLARTFILAHAAKALNAGSMLGKLPLFHYPVMLLTPLVGFISHLIAKKNESREAGRADLSTPLIPNTDYRPPSSKKAILNVAGLSLCAISSLIGLYYSTEHKISGTYSYPISGFGFGKGTGTTNMSADRTAVIGIMWTALAASFVPVLPLLNKLAFRGCRTLTERCPPPRCACPCRSAAISTAALPHQEPTEPASK